MKTIANSAVSVFLYIISGRANRPGSPVSARRRPGLPALAAVFCLLPASSFGLALFNDTVSLTPADQEMSNLANNVVRLYQSYGPAGDPPETEFGTGTIISIVQDGQGGYYYNVLTANHVVSAAVGAVNAGNFGSIGIGFGNHPGYTIGNFFPLTVNNLASNVRLDGGNGVDLAVFSVDVSAKMLAAAAPGPANILAPGFGVNGLQLEVPIAAPSDAPGNTIVQAGYGVLASAKLGDPAPPGQARYAPIASSYGEFNSGGNTIPADGLVGRLDLNYPGFDAIIGTFAFTRDARNNIISGTTDLMSGDSGGPTFQANNGIYDLIGVHQGSQFDLNFKDKTTWALPGQSWTDVDVSAYTSWINQAITQVDVPEPSTWALVAAGVLVWLFRCGRRRAGFLTVAAIACLLPASSFGLALFNDTVPLTTDQELPNLANNVVRVSAASAPAGDTPANEYGTGTIISIVPDGHGGDYYNVLTADHILYAPVEDASSKGFGSISLGFGSIPPPAITPAATTAQSFPLTVNNLVANVQLDGGKNVDLAVFSVDVTAQMLAAAGPAPNQILAPGIGPLGLQTTLPIAVPSNAKNNQIVQAGYGLEAILGQGEPDRYLPKPGTYGTYNSGGNTIPSDGLAAAYEGASNPRGGRYVFDAILGGATFTTDTNGVITKATS